MFSTLSLPLVKEESSTGEKVFLSWSSIICLQFQEVLPTYKIEFWYELTIAILIWENIELCFRQKYALMSSLEGEEVNVGWTFRIVVLFYK